jgi:hypothetical protein
MKTKQHQDPDREPASGTGDAPVDADDVEGHSMLQAQFGQQTATTRSREAAEWARGEKARREAERARKDRKGR